MMEMIKLQTLVINVKVSEGNTNYINALAGKPYILHVCKKLPTPQLTAAAPLLIKIDAAVRISLVLVPISASRSNTVRISSFHPIFFGSIAGQRFSISALSSSRSRPDL